MGIIFIKRKEYIMAREYLEKALEHDPKFHDASHSLLMIRKK